MSTLPSLNHALSSDFDYRQYKTSQSWTQSTQLKSNRTPIINWTPHRLQAGKVDSFKPLAIIGRIDLSTNLRTKCTYAWTRMLNEANQSTCQLNIASIQSQMHAASQSKLVSVNEERSTEEDKDNKDIHLELQSHKDSEELDNLNEQSWMCNNKGSKSKPKAIPDKRLAVRSDVVNKTLLRSLKRYYTAEFENFTQFKLQGKTMQK